MKGSKPDEAAMQRHRLDLACEDPFGRVANERCSHVYAWRAYTHTYTGVVIISRVFRQFATSKPRF